MQNRQNTRWSKAELKEAEQLYYSGFSIEKIEKKIGRNWNAIRTKLQRNGIDVTSKNPFVKELPRKKEYKSEVTSHVLSGNFATITITIEIKSRENENAE